MNIVLTHTYFLGDDGVEKKIMKPYPPLGLLYLSAFLKQNDVTVNIYDTTFSNYQDLIQYLNQASPDILGIHCNLLTKFTVLKLIQYCQENKIVSILGGPDASTQKYELPVLILLFREKEKNHYFRSLGPLKENQSTNCLRFQM